MNNNQTSYLSDISSFEDFIVEKERLKLKRQLVEAKLNLDYLRISRIFSISDLIFSFAKEEILPKISDIIMVLLSKVETKVNS